MNGLAWLIVGAVVLLALVWGFAVEPNLLTVTKKTMRFERLPEKLNGLRVVLFSDVHAGPRYRVTAIERMAKEIDGLEPDLVLFCGDLLHRQSTADQLDAQRIAAALGIIRAPLGKYAVYGNHDVWTARTEQITADILDQAGFVLLDNESALVEDGLSVAGTRSYTMTDYAVSRPDPQNALKDATGFVLLLSHESDQFIANAQYPFDLQLSGHSHGGQVTIPLIGPILLPKGSKNYPYGEYSLKDHKLFVTRGIGTSILKVRFNAPPEVVVLTLECAK